MASILLGFLIAWVLVRYEFPVKRVFDSLIDLPFALPTAVAGLVYSGLYVENGWLGQFLVPLGIQGAYSRLAVVLVLTFLGIPFVVRTLAAGAGKHGRRQGRGRLFAGRQPLADVLAGDFSDA